MIQPSDIVGVDAMTARRVISVARSIAPCLDSLVDGTGETPQPKSDAIAIITGVALDVVARGARSIKSQSVASARVEYVVGVDSFSAEDAAALRALCAASIAASAGPIGQFPTNRPFAGLWPEETCES